MNTKAQNIGTGMILGIVLMILVRTIISLISSDPTTSDRVVKDIDSNEVFRYEFDINQPIGDTLNISCHTPLSPMEMKRIVVIIK